jgi:hypothetical protein
MTTAPKRRWFAFSLRTLFVVVTGLSAYFALWRWAPGGAIFSTILAASIAGIVVPIRGSRVHPLAAVVFCMLDPGRQMLSTTGNTASTRKLRQAAAVTARGRMNFRISESLCARPKRPKGTLMTRIRFAPACYSAKACAVTLVILLLSDVVLAQKKPAQKEPGFISLILTSVSAVRYVDYVSFECHLQINNDTGAAVTVPSRYSNPFGDLELVVTDMKGKVLSQTPYKNHRTTNYSTPRPVAIKQGETTVRLPFPVFGFDEKAKTVKARVVGVFAGSEYQRICSTDTLQISIEDSKREAQ